MRELADGYAAQGYVALCPDLFWRQEPGVQLSEQSVTDWARALELYKGFSEVKGVADLITSLEHLRRDLVCTGKVGVVGFCLGGKLAYLMATRSSADCAVCYYGVGIEKDLAEATAITKPLLLHFAENDEFCPPSAQDAIKAAMAKVALASMHIYRGAFHAFARPDGGHYDPAAATAANHLTTDFLAEHLRS
jgi:carboxymethylenebutenolidase